MVCLKCYKNQCVFFVIFSEKSALFLRILDHCAKMPDDYWDIFFLQSDSILHFAEDSDVSKYIFINPTRVITKMFSALYEIFWLS